MNPEPFLNEPPELPVTSPSSGSVDITDLVSKMKGSWVQITTNYIMEVAIGAFAPVGWPILRPVFSFIIKKLITIIADTVEMEAFFVNTGIRKASQASDYIDAMNAKNSLPTWATDAQYEEAERNEMRAFRNFVLLTE